MNRHHQYFIICCFVCFFPVFFGCDEYVRSEQREQPVNYNQKVLASRLRTLTSQILKLRQRVYRVLFLSSQYNHRAAQRRHTLTMRYRVINGYQHKLTAMSNALQRECSGMSPKHLLSKNILTLLSRVAQMPPLAATSRCDEDQRYIAAREVVSRLQNVFQGQCQLLDELYRFQSSLKRSLRCLKMRPGTRSSVTAAKQRKWRCYIERSKFRIVQIYAIRAISLQLTSTDSTRLLVVKTHIDILLKQLHRVSLLLQLKNSGLARAQRQLKSVRQELFTLQKWYDKSSESTSERMATLYRFMLKRAMKHEDLWYKRAIHVLGYTVNSKLRALPKRFCSWYRYDPMAYSKQIARQIYRRRLKNCKKKVKSKRKKCLLLLKKGVVARSVARRPVPAKRMPNMKQRRTVRQKPARLYCRLHGIADTVRYYHLSLNFERAGCVIARPRFLRLMRTAWDTIYVRTWVMHKRSLQLSRWFAEQSRSIPGVLYTLSQFAARLDSVKQRVDQKNSGMTPARQRRRQQPPSDDNETTL